MRVVAFTKTNERGPSSRYRFYGLRGPLRAHDVELELHPLFGDGWFRVLRLRSRLLRGLAKALYAPVRLLARLYQLRRARGAALVIVEHQLLPYLPAWGERWLARRPERWILEFDDAIHLTRLHGKKMVTLCRLADHVVVGNRSLADFAAPHARAVSVVPTTVDTDALAPRQHHEGGDPRVVGWIGLPYNLGALARLTAPLRRVAQEIPLVLRVVSAGDPQIRGVPIDLVEWREDREGEELRRFDVGVMPLADDAWSRGKCGLKVLQYFAAGVPVVASPVGVNAEIVTDGENGLLASTDGEWCDALARLLRDEELRRRLARAGRRTVEERFARRTWVPRIAALWRTTAGPVTKP